MKKVTTSAQKTLTSSKAVILKKLKASLQQQEKVIFHPTRNPDILKADKADGSSLYVAAFKKTDGSNLAMIDHKNINESDRRSLQAHWRHTIDTLFKDA